jgi:predicted nucleic acid-binding protein
MNGDKYFVDSNVFLYIFDETNPAKTARAEAWLAWLWENACGALSWQVIQEFYWNALRKYRAAPAKARDFVRLMSEWNPPDVTITLIERAWHWTDQAQVTFWDALIVAAAERTQCRYLLSEDFQSGRQFGPITVVNPFKTAPEQTH